LEANGISSEAFAALGPAQRGDATRVFTASEGRLLGAIELADPVREQTRDAVERLRDLHVEIRIVSGDVSGAVEAVASKLGITQWNAQVSPEGKAEIVQALRAAHRRVAFIGDGINDAPALASAGVCL
jgi:P-type E1-E2 ATPase